MRIIQELMSNKWVSITDVTGCHSQAGELGGWEEGEGDENVGEVELKETIRFGKNSQKWREKQKEDEKKTLHLRVAQKQQQKRNHERFKRSSQSQVAMGHEDNCRIYGNQPH